MNVPLLDWGEVFVQSFLEQGPVAARLLFILDVLLSIFKQVGPQVPHQLCHPHAAVLIFLQHQDPGQLILDPLLHPWGEEGPDEGVGCSGLDRKNIFELDDYEVFEVELGLGSLGILLKDDFVGEELEVEVNDMVGHDAVGLKQPLLSLPPDCVVLGLHIEEQQLKKVFLLWLVHQSMYSNITI